MSADESVTAPRAGSHPGETPVHARPRDRTVKVWLLFERVPGRLSQLMGIYDNKEAADEDARRMGEDCSVDEWTVDHDPVVS